MEAVAETTGPTTFAEAFAADASSASSTSDTTQVAPSGADTTAPSTDSASAEGSPQPAGEPPRERWDSILSNARTKAREEAEAQIRQQYGAQFDQLTRLTHLFQTDRPAFFREIVGDDQAMVAEAARFLASRRGQSQPSVDLNPIPIELSDGRTVGMFSAEQIQHAVSQAVQQAEARMEQKLAPAMTAAEKVRHAEMTAQAESFATGLIGEMEGYQGFTENRDAIGQEVKRALSALQPNDPRANDPTFLEAATLRAYQKVVLPKLSQQAKSSQLDELQRKATASTAPNPGSAVPTAPRDIKSFSDPRLVW